MLEQNAVGTQLVQEIAAVALATSNNFLPKIFNILTGFAKCLTVEMVNRQAKDNDAESSIMEIAPWVGPC